MKERGIGECREVTYKLLDKIPDFLQVDGAVQSNIEMHLTEVSLANIARSETFEIEVTDYNFI